MKAYKGNRGRAPPILNLVFKCELSTSNPGLFIARKETGYPLIRNLGGPQSGSGRFRT
jgi:hypothetical protein